MNVSIWLVCRAAAVSKMGNPQRVVGAVYSAIYSRMFVQEEFELVLRFSL